MEIDLKNIHFAIHVDDVAVFKFLMENNFNFLTEQIPVISNISNKTYGIVYVADNKYVFCKHKAIEINKSKQPPKFNTFIQKTFKIISKEEFENFFIKTSNEEILNLEMQEEKGLC